MVQSPGSFWKLQIKKLWTLKQCLHLTTNWYNKSTWKIFTSLLNLYFCSCNNFKINFNYFDKIIHSSGTKLDRKSSHLLPQTFDYSVTFPRTLDILRIDCVHKSKCICMNMYKYMDTHFCYFSQIIANNWVTNTDNDSKLYIIICVSLV